MPKRTVRSSPCPSDPFHLLLHQPLCCLWTQSRIMVVVLIIVEPPEFMPTRIENHEVPPFNLGFCLFEILRGNNVPLLHITKIHDDTGTVTFFQGNLVKHHPTL